MKRRTFLNYLGVAPFGISSENLFFPAGEPLANGRVQLSVNAYSFNKMLRNGDMTFPDMMDFAAGIGLDAVDLTAYYFSSYPDVPPDHELYSLKRKALELGLDIPWTGVRNDFVTTDDTVRRTGRELIKKWLTVSSKLGASIMRIFTGKDKPEVYQRNDAKKRMIDEFRNCTEYAEEYGVILGLQNHNDFLYSSDEIIEIIEKVDSEWFGLILDAGSLHASDPYDELRKLAPYANYWFVKEHIYPGGEKTNIDMQKIAGILKEYNYRGYISFESLSEGDPKMIVKSMADAFRNAFG